MDATGSVIAAKKKQSSFECKRHEKRRKTTKTPGVTPMVKSLSKPSRSPISSMAANNNNQATANSGSNDAAILRVTTTTAGNVRMRGTTTKDALSAPSSIPTSLLEKEHGEDHEHPKCCFAWPVWVRVVAKTEIMALAIEVAYIVAFNMEFPEAVVIVLLATLLTFIAAIVVLFLATLTERSRAMLNTIILARKKGDSHEVEQNFPQKLDFVSLAPSEDGASNEWLAV